MSRSVRQPHEDSCAPIEIDRLARARSLARRLLVAFAALTAALLLQHAAGSSSDAHATPPAGMPHLRSVTHLGHHDRVAHLTTHAPDRREDDGWIDADDDPSSRRRVEAPSSRIVIDAALDLRRRSSAYSGYDPYDVFPPANHFLVESVRRI